MNPYIAELKRRLTESPPSFGDGDSILTMLYESYCDSNRMDDDQIKTDFRELYQAMNEMPLRDMDRIIDPIYPDFAHKKETPPIGDSTFREKVKRDLNFDPNRHYEDMMFLELRLDESGLPENGAEWVVQTAREQHDADRAGDTSLVEQVEKLPKKKPE